MEKELPDRDYVSVLSDVLESRSLDEACMRFAFSTHHRGSIRGIALFRVVKSEFIELSCSFGDHVLELESFSNVWKEDIVGRCVRSQNSEIVSVGDSEVSITPLVSTGLGRGVLVVSSIKGQSLPSEVKKFHRAISLVGGHLLEKLFPETHSAVVGTTALSGDSFSSRQLEILRLVHSGVTNESIARKLHVSVSTVRQELMRIFKLLAVTDRKSAAEKAVDLKILPA